MADTEYTNRDPFLNPWRIAGWGFAALLLSLPAIAMQFTREVNRDAFDFVVMAITIGSVGLGLELAVRASGNVAFRAGSAVALLTGFLVTWSNLAVGIIGDEDSPANLMFFGVVGIALAGGFIARFRPPGMSQAMTAAAIAQFAVPLIAMAVWSPPFDLGLARTLVFNSAFAAMWLAAAWLFSRSNE